MGKMLTQAQKVSHHTDGVFSLFIKEALEEKGYGEKTSNMEQLPFSEEKNEILISADSISITGNKGIDLGGIGKGYLIDKLATLLKEEYGLPYFLINGGGDIYVTSDREKEIQLFLEHPVHDGEYINAIAIKNKAFCSSSSFKRRWNKDGKEVNHFIASDEVWAASYCIGETATITDMYATVFCIIANKKDTLEKIAISQHIDYCVIGDDGKIVISKRFPSFL
jgi:thiamine biosynthesis lipoprotein